MPATGPPEVGPDPAVGQPLEGAEAGGSATGVRSVGGSSDSQKTVISRRPPVSAPAFLRAASPFEMGSALTGEQLGHFQLEEFVGGGGMGAVFRATDTMLGRTVAVKVVSRDETTEETLRRFRNEAQSAARLDHPNIARVYYVGEDKGWNYIVFEYIEGVNVRDLVEHNGPLSLEDAIRYTLQMAEALDHASQRDVIHRDIKPSNILIMLDGRAKLVDMGLARLHHVESPAEDLTASGVTLGTFDYISPEQARDPRNTDVRSDLYSLGCTLFFMLTGQPPFPEGTVLQKLLSHSSEEPPDVLEARPDLPPEIAAVVKRMLAKQPDQRFQTPRDLIGELLLLADRLNLTAITASSTIWLSPTQPQAAWWVRHVPWIAPACVLAAVVLIQSWLDRAPDAPPPDPRLAPRRETAAAVESMPNQVTGKVPVHKTPGDASVPNGASPPQVPRDRSPEPAGAHRAPGTGMPASAGPPGGAAETVAPNTLDTPKPAPEAPSSQTAPADKTPASRLAPPATNATSTPPALPETTEHTAAAAPVADMPWSDAGTAGAKVTNPHILIVSDDDVQLDRSMLCVRSLEKAITLAAELKSVAEIRLRFNGIRALRPIELDLDSFAQRKLTVRPADGFAPIIACEEPSNGAGGASPGAMIRVHRGRLTWRDTHFYLRFPADADDSSDRSLFQLDAVDEVEFSRCTFTVCNLGPDGQPAERAVAVFDLAPVDALAGFLYDLQPPGDMPTIRLIDCAARGQTTLVRSAEARPFWLTWEHGVFISSEQIVELGGAAFQPPWDVGPVTLGLKRLLVFADHGIALVHTDSHAPYPVGLTAKSQTCLFATRLTRPPTALYLFRGQSPLASADSQILIGGSNNFYKNTNVVLRVESSDDQSTVEEYAFDDLRGNDAQGWFSERNFLPATVFSWLPPAQSADRQQLDDFIQPGGSGDWFVGDLEIAPAALPRFPDYSSLLPRADLRLPPPNGHAVPRS